MLGLHNYNKEVGARKMDGSTPGSDPSVRDACAPTFAPRKGVLSREYHVLVVWPDGRRMKVGQFLRKPDAARWIERKSSEWLAQQHAAGDSH